jgi:DHA3 family macrolide efflux protein-like MFS transporter
MNMGKSLLSQPVFRKVWLAQLVSVFGDFLALFGVINAITFRMHGSPADVVLVTMAYTAPVALVSPFAGVLVDRWPIKRVMILSDVLRAFIAASLVLGQSVPQIAVSMALLGLVSSFFAPAQAVAIRTLIAQEDLLSANAYLQTAFYVVRIVAPAIAGLLVHAFTEKVCFWFDSFSFVFSAAMISTLAIVRPAGPKKEQHLGRDFLEGNRFIFTHRELGFAFTASAMAMLVLSSFSPLISIYIRDTVHAGSREYGIISAMVGFGLIVGTAFVRKASQSWQITTLILGGCLLLAVGAVLLGGFHNVFSAGASTFTIGFAIAFVIVPGTTLSQKATPPQMQARVSSTFISLFSLAQVLGLFVSGALAQALSVRGLFFGAAGVMVLLSLAGRGFLKSRAATVSG